MASRLLELADRLGEDRDGAVVVPLPVTQAELAGWAGTSLETTVRALSALRRAGWLTTGRGTISILDRAAVARRAGRPEA
ncbi:Crp/Fnr family transcriptional regulator [Conexibacter sp. W3-3-2]|uniref:helix-turn-helix domain-containing protein n=1 Tax=Conexibacter sp. W3-3-2 TaxID=2675227 RepID=UPI0018AAFE4E|nr:Crp/Fnr family transcriptional regulator [Conexibacter sp. W3-3-2]